MCVPSYAIGHFLYAHVLLFACFGTDVHYVCACVLGYANFLPFVRGLYYLNAFVHYYE